MQKKLFFLVALMLTMTLSVMAQVTTSSMTGKVSMEGSNEEIIGASVQAVHEPSGTRYTAVTNVNGRFTIQGMRTGGPYAVTVSYIGHQTKVMKGVTLQLGETYKLDVWLSENSTDLAEVVVSGRASKFAAEKTGASTNISNQMMMSMPTMSRSIEDMARISPYAGSGMSFAGGDGRSSNFTLDGANLNNNFGLNDGLPGGGTPVSLEAIDEIQVVVAPYDVRQSNFIGGGVNAITKSGTNTFKGTAYTYFQSDKLHGTKIGDYDVTYEKKKQTVYGFTLGGPIIKDKLFFFANYEKSITPQSVVDWRASVDGVADASAKIARTTLADMETVSNFVREKYGYNTGSWTDFNGDKDNTKFIVRLDWNITQNHHLSLRYNTTTDNSWTNTNKTSAPTKLSQSRAASKYSMTFNNSMYSTEKNVNSWSADLNSRFGQHASNQLLFTYTHIKDGRGSDSSKFPFVDILDGTGGLVPYMGLGYELFTWNNGVENNVTTAIDNFTYFLGSHKITAGASFEHQMANNNFMRYGTGYYRYSSLNDFLTGAAPECVALTHGYNGNGNPSNEVRFNQYGFYLQDEWDVTNRLKLNYGIRFDYLQFNDDDVMRNNAIYNLDFGGRHVDTGMWPNSNVQVSPRFGFVWDVMGDKSLKIRGGSGLFAGRLPLVFFTNMPTNSGMIQNIIVAEKGDPRLASFAGGLITDTEQIRTLLGGPTTISPADGLKQSSVVGVDRDFKMPQVWKSSIAIDYNVPVSFPLSLTGEFTYTKKINDVMIENWNIKSPDETWERLVGADNRYIYPNDFRYDSSFSKTDGACILTNTHKGYGWTANVTVNAEPVKNLKLMAAYTHTVVKEVTGMPGSQAASTWANNYTVNGPNQAGLHNSTYMVPDRVIASINYNVYKEHFTLFYTGLPGYDGQSLYSYYYDGDINNDGIATDLIYIPANDSEINFVSEEDRVAFWKFVDQDDYLRNHKGEYAEAFGVRAPWLHRFDFKFAHDIDLKIGNTKHKLQLSCDIMNIGNLLNSEWGVSKSMAPCNNGQFLKVAKIEKGVPYFEMKKVNGEYISKTWEPYRSYSNCWSLQVGLKYFFN
jgi:hypothetical protein